MNDRRSAPFDPVAHGMYLETLDPRVGGAVKLILQIAGGDFTARGEVTERRDELDAIVVGLNMLAESFEREREARDRAEMLLADAIDSYENAPGYFCSVDVATRAVIKSNQTFADAFGTAKEDLQGRSILDLCVDGSRNDLERALEKLVGSDGRPSRISDLPPRAHGRAPEIELARADGQTLTVSLSGSVMRDDAGRPLRLRLTLRDVTVERRLEAQLLHSQKMEAIGQLAGGVAHDFNNLLMVIQSATSLMARKITPDSAQAALLQQTQEATGRAAALTRQLLTFARREVARPSTIDVGQLVLRNQNMLARLLGASIALDVRAPDGPKLVHIDPTRLEQALMNLVINARDAMPDGGSLTIATDQVSTRHGCSVRSPTPGKASRPSTSRASSSRSSRPSRPVAARAWALPWRTASSRRRAVRCACTPSTATAHASSCCCRRRRVRPRPWALGWASLSPVAAARACSWSRTSPMSGRSWRRS